MNGLNSLCQKIFENRVIIFYIKNKIDIISLIYFLNEKKPLYIITFEYPENHLGVKYLYKEFNLYRILMQIKKINTLKKEELREIKNFIFETLIFLFKHKGYNVLDLIGNYVRGYLEGEVLLNYIIKKLGLEHKSMFKRKKSIFLKFLTESYRDFLKNDYKE